MNLLPFNHAAHHTPAPSDELRKGETNHPLQLMEEMTDVLFTDRLMDSPSNNIIIVSKRIQRCNVS